MSYPEFMCRTPLTRTLIGIIVMCLFAGCMTLQEYKLYKGPQLPGDKVAVLINKGETIVLQICPGHKPFHHLDCLCHQWYALL